MCSKRKKWNKLAIEKKEEVLGLMLKVSVSGQYQCSLVLQNEPLEISVRTETQY
jgi:hypothetical protein